MVSRVNEINAVSVEREDSFPLSVSESRGNV